jgi:hypothetical protein
MYYNSDGGTSFYLWSAADPTPLTCGDMENYSIDQYDGTYGRKMFYEARGYKVGDCYAQYTDNIAEGGFSLADYKAEIKAGRPVFLNLAGHSVVGYGFGTGTTIYIRDTWSSDPANIATMEWGGDYYGMTMYGVSMVKVKAQFKPVLVSPNGKIYDKTPTYKFSQVWKGRKYQVRLFKGDETSSFYTVPVSLTMCSNSWCEVTPTKLLPKGDYTWQARAYVNGKWRAWSARMPFTVK